MRRYKFFSSYVYPVSLMCDALVYVCVYGCMSAFMSAYVSQYAHVYTCVRVWCVGFTFITCTQSVRHDDDTTIQIGKRQRRSRGAGDPIAILRLLEEGFTFFSRFLPVFSLLLFFPTEGATERSSLRTIHDRSLVLPRSVEPGETSLKRSRYSLVSSTFLLSPPFSSFSLSFIFSCICMSPLGFLIVSLSISLSLPLFHTLSL